MTSQKSEATGSSSASVVKAVDLTGGFNTTFYPVEVEISGDHAIFKGSGVVSPISKIIGHPILIYRHLRDNPLDYLHHPKRADLDNQSVTYMMIDPICGFAPPEWQCGVGRVTIARQDKAPLTKAQLETIWMYCDRIIEWFGNGEGPPLEDYNPAAYETFAREYEVKMKENAEEWERIKSTDWGAVLAKSKSVGL